MPCTSVCTPIPNAKTVNSCSSKNVADVLARPMSSLATDGAIPGAKATQAQQVYGNSEGGGHQGSSVVKPEKYESVDTPTPPPESNHAAVGSSNGGSGNGQTQNGEMKIKKKKKGGGGKIRIKLNLPDKDSTFYTLPDQPVVGAHLTYSQCRENSQSGGRRRSVRRRLRHGTWCHPTRKSVTRRARSAPY